MSKTLASVTRRPCWSENIVDMGRAKEKKSFRSLGIQHGTHVCGNQNDIAVMLYGLCMGSWYVLNDVAVEYYGTCQPLIEYEIPNSFTAVCHSFFGA